MHQVEMPPVLPLRLERARIEVVTIHALPRSVISAARTGSWSFWPRNWRRSSQFLLLQRQRLLAAAQQLMMALLQPIFLPCLPMPSAQSPRHRQPRRFDGPTAWNHQLLRQMIRWKWTASEPRAAHPLRPASLLSRAAAPWSR